MHRYTPSRTMHRRTFVGGATAFLASTPLIGSVAASHAPAAARRQEIPGLSAEVLASGPVTDDPGRMLLQLRVTLEPGTIVPPHIHPGDLVFSVESGTIDYTTLDGEVDVLWGKAGDESAEQVVTVGDTATLTTGDYLVERNTVIHTVRSVDDESAVLLISGHVASDEPFLQLVDWPATPAP